MCKMKLEHKITRIKKHEGQVQIEAELFVEKLRLVSKNHFKKNRSAALRTSMYNNVEILNDSYKYCIFLSSTLNHIQDVGQ